MIVTLIVWAAIFLIAYPYGRLVNRNFKFCILFKIIFYNRGWIEGIWEVLVQ